MQLALLWWLPGAALIASPTWWLGWRAHQHRELASFMEVTVRMASNYAAQHVGPGQLRAVAQQLEFTRRPPRPTSSGLGHRHLKRAMKQSFRRQGLKCPRIRRYLSVTVLAQVSGEPAVTVERVVGTSGWHALEEMARAKSWPLGTAGPPPWWVEPTLDDMRTPGVVLPNDAVLIYIFAHPGRFAWLGLRVAAIGRRLRRVASRVWAVVCAVRSRTGRWLRRIGRGSRRGRSRGERI